jgi:Tol biopolymer transport system component
MNFKETQLTFDEYGHSIHNYQVFSPDDQWIVYDIRNHDSLIISTGSIRIVNVVSAEIKELYTTFNQSKYGPGVGAASFSPKEDKVIFIHGIRNATKKTPYGFTRRTGVSIDLKHPLHPIFMDARDVFNPFTPGALRGGTHAHSWSGDGKWISFTYNDFIMEQLSKTDVHVKDLRTIGIMVPFKKVKVSDHTSFENNDGEMFSVVVAKVIEKPRPSSDEIEKAFDECWIGEKGYQKVNGDWQEKALAFQGNVITHEGLVKTECFVVDLPEDVSRAKVNSPLEGSHITRPNVPDTVFQRRITYTENGMEGPRHWLRTTSDGSLIAFLMKDKEGIVQIFGVSPNGGNIKQLTFNAFSVQSQFNFSPDDKRLAYSADNSIFITDMINGNAKRITIRFNDSDKPVNGVVWSNNGKMLAYNRYVKSVNGSFIQIFLLKN